MLINSKAIFFLPTASVTDYKASLYTLMAYTLQSDLKAAEQVARYLFYRSHVLDRHPEVRYRARHVQNNEHGAYFTTYCLPIHSYST